MFATFLALSILGLHQLATFAFTLPTLEDAIVNGTEGSGRSLRASEREPNYHAECKPAAETPPDFRCGLALGQMKDQIDPAVRYTISKFSLPYPNSYMVPKQYVSGSCELQIDIAHQFPYIRMLGEDLVKWAGLLVETCVADESFSGGGILKVRNFKRPPNNITFAVGESPLSESGVSVVDKTAAVIGLPDASGK